MFFAQSSAARCRFEPSQSILVGDTLGIRSRIVLCIPILYQPCTIWRRASVNAPSLTCCQWYGLAWFSSRVFCFIFFPCRIPVAFNVSLCTSIERLSHMTKKEVLGSSCLGEWISSCSCSEQLVGGVSSSCSLRLGVVFVVHVGVHLYWSTYVHKLLTS